MERRPELVCVLLEKGLSMYVSGGGVGGADVPAAAINPLQVVMQALGTQEFVVTLSGGSGSVVWAVDGIAGGNSTVGTVDGSGNYVAPWQAGFHVVTATATIGDSTPFATASVNVSTTAPGVTVVTTTPTDASYIGALTFDSVAGILYIYTSGGWVTA